MLHGADETWTFEGVDMATSGRPPRFCAPVRGRDVDLVWTKEKVAYVVDVSR